MNRLASESSPYLRQHRDNPVDWYPWDEEAFARAKAEDKPVMLSVGYAACHWCHVMAHESFEDEETATLLNRLFVNVKVDREERPDVDAVYMEAVQAMTGHGGWPMTVWLTPEGRPFYGGTYFPRHARPGLPSFTQVCKAVADAWRTKRVELDAAASQLTDMVGRSSLLSPSGENLPGLEALASTRDALAARFDTRFGGFGPAPKFPQPDVLEALLRQYAHDADPHTLEMVTTTLDAMAAGGMYDHLGGGFARYSVDDRWLVPHFEKMLYDQALLAAVYLHAWQVTGEPRYLQVLTETIDYVRRDLRHPEGGFFSSEDADSEGEEGKFYVWAKDEIEALLGDETARRGEGAPRSGGGRGWGPVRGGGAAEDIADEAIRWWGVTAEGNFEGANILFRPKRGDLARSPAVERARQVLFETREKRVRPGLDDKVLTEWNCLFLSALAPAAAATGRSDWLDDARACGEFLLSELRRPDGRWLRSWQGPSGPTERGTQHGPSRHFAYASDYAAAVGAFTRLSEATGEARWIGEARSTANAMLELFWDTEAGGLFTTGNDAEVLITRPKDVIDHATPSANSVAAVSLLRLSALIGDDGYRQRVEDIVRLMATPLRQHPTAFCHLLGAVDMLASSVTEVVISGDRPDLVRAVQRLYIPNAVLAWGEPYPSPLFEGRSPGVAYVCQNYACSAPTGDVEELLAQLGTTVPAG